MKRFLAILLVLCMVLSLAACGGDSGGSNTPSQGESGGSKEPTTLPTHNGADDYDDPGENDDPDYSDDEDETTEPTQAAIDLSDVPNPLGLNSLILAAYFQNANNYGDENDPVEVTLEMIEGIRSIEFHHEDWEETSKLILETYYVTNKAEAASEEEYEYEYTSIVCPLAFVPDLSGDNLDAIWEDLKIATKLYRFALYIVDIESLEGLANFPELENINIIRAESLTSLAGLENATELRYLYCRDTNLSDISALANLTNLENVELTDSNISDLTPLAGLTNLEVLRLHNNPISNISPLANLPKLEQLNFIGTQVTELPAGGTTRVTSISYPDGMTGLGNLPQWVADGADLHLTLMDDISLAGFENFTYLRTLNLTGSKITNEDLTYLRNVAIDSLLISGTPVTDLSALAGNTGLKEIGISGTGVTDLSPLASCTGLESIFAEGTGITDVSCLEGMESLTYLNLSGTPMTDVSSVTKIPNLKTLYLNYKEDLTDVSPLVNCPSLQYLYLARCTNIKDISALATSTTLKMINIYGIEGLDTSAFDGTEIEIRDYY